MFFYKPPISVLSVTAVFILSACSGDEQNLDKNIRPVQAWGAAAPVGERDAEYYKGGNLAPVIQPLGVKKVRPGELLGISVVATDPEGDALTYRLVSSSSLVPSATNMSGIFQVRIPGETTAQTITLTVEVSDRVRNVARESVLVAVEVEGNSVIKDALKDTCSQIEDSLQRSVCELGSAFVK